jgi:hypothetical protein
MRNLLQKELIKFIREQQGSISKELVGYIKELAFYDVLYLHALYQKYWEKEKSLKIGKNFIPSAFLNKNELGKNLKVISYLQIAKDSSLDKFAGKADLICNPMDAGLGSSLARLKYLTRIWKELKRPGKPHLGAKGEDLYFNLETSGSNEKINVTEIKYLHTIQAAHFYNKIIIQELVNEATIGSIDDFLDKTIRQLISKKKKIELSEEMVVQASLPTIDKKTNQLTLKRVAPGGHGQLGFMVLGEAMQDKKPSAKSLIRIIYNGDGPNNFPDQKIIGFMVKHKIPIIMITSTKTPIDQKGGQIGLELNKNGKRPQILELAQAKNSGQEELFKKVGIKKVNKTRYGKIGKQYFNTNIALINYSVILPFLKDLYELVGIKEFSKIISPDLIKNEKIQNDKVYIQLEGALASTLLNLAGFVKTTKDKKIIKLIRRHDINDFLTIVNIGKQNRTKFFTPIKYAWDFWFYAYSDHFKLDRQSFKLKNLKPGNFPGFELDSFYQDLENCINSFGNASTLDLIYLSIRGKVSLKDAKLVGSVIIESKAEGIVDLNSKLIKNKLSYKNGRLFLKNIKITIEKNKEINIEKLTAD